MAGAMVFSKNSYSTVHSNKFPLQFFEDTDLSHSGRCLGRKLSHFTACHRAAALPLGEKWLKLWVGREGTVQVIIGCWLVATTIVQLANPIHQMRSFGMIWNRFRRLQFCGLCLRGLDGQSCSGDFKNRVNVVQTHLTPHVL